MGVAPVSEQRAREPQRRNEAISNRVPGPSAAGVFKKLLLMLLLLLLLLLRKRKRRKQREIKESTVKRRESEWVKLEVVRLRTCS